MRLMETYELAVLLRLEKVKKEIVKEKRLGEIGKEMRPPLHQKYEENNVRGD